MNAGRNQMELSTFSLDCGQEPPPSSMTRSRENQCCERDDNVYDPAQEILATCNRDLEELRMKVLKTSVRCHMLEVDLATQFNPRNQQLYVDAQESCKQCSEALRTTHQVVIKRIDSSSLQVAPPTTTAKQSGGDAAAESSGGTGKQDLHHDDEVCEGGAGECATSPICV